MGLTIGLLVAAIIFFIYLKNVFNLCDVNKPSSTCPFLTPEKARFMRYTACSMALCENGVPNGQTNNICLEYDSQNPDTCSVRCGDVVQGSKLTDDQLIQSGYKITVNGKDYVSNRPSSPVSDATIDNWRLFGPLHYHYCGNGRDNPGNNYLQIQLDNPVTLGSNELEQFMNSIQVVATKIQLRSPGGPLWDALRPLICPDEEWHNENAIMVGKPSDPIFNLLYKLCGISWLEKLSGGKTTPDCFAGSHRDFGATPLLSWDSSSPDTYPSAVYVKKSYADANCNDGGKRSCVSGGVGLPIVVAGFMPFVYAADDCGNPGYYQTSCLFKSTDTGSKITYSIWGQDSSFDFWGGCGYASTSASTTPSVYSKPTAPTCPLGVPCPTTLTLSFKNDFNCPSGSATQCYAGYLQDAAGNPVSGATINWAIEYNTIFGNAAGHQIDSSKGVNSPVVTGSDGKFLFNDYQSGASLISICSQSTLVWYNGNSNYAPVAASLPINPSNNCTARNPQYGVDYSIVGFVENGLPVGTSWGTDFNGVSNSGTTGVITYFDTPVGSLAWSSSATSYTANPSSGTLNIPSQTIQNIVFQK